MSNETFKIKNGLTLTPVDLTSLTNPQAGDLACDINDLNKIKRYDANSLGWTEVGSGGVGNVNALLTQTFDTAALAQFTQTGLALTTSNPIDGTQSARLIHQAASSQSFKQVIAVDRKYRGDLMAMSLQVRSSATSGNLTLLVTDETNSAVIMASSSISTGQYQVATAVTNATTTISGFSNVDINLLKVGMTITGAGIPTATVISSINTAANTIVISQAATASATITAKFSALPDRKSFSFTIPTNCASLSYTITALQEAGLPESYIDDVVIELANVSLLETSVTVPNLTAWQGYTPTITGFGTPTAVEFEWRQVGENVEVRGKFASGVPTAVEARVSLPNGLTSAGTGLIPSIQIVGKSIRGVAATSAAKQHAILIEPSVSYITIGIDDTTFTISPFTKQLANNLISAGELYSFFASVPCAGLSASSSVSIPLTQSGLVQEADFRLRAIGNGGTAVTSLVTDIPFTYNSGLGSSASWNGSQLTIIKSGIYSIKTGVVFTTSVSRLAALYVNGTFRDYLGITSTSTAHEGNLVDYFTAGQVLSIRASGGGTLLNDISHFLTITNEGSLKQVSVNTNSKITIPTSELRFEGASSRGTADVGARVIFTSQAKIRGDAFTSVTDATGTIVTVQKAGIVNATCSLVAASATYGQIVLNSTVVTAFDVSGNGGSGSWNGTVAVGDTLRVVTGVVPNGNPAISFALSFQEQEIQVSVSNTLPQFSESDSCVRLSGANGFGSSATTTRRFASTIQNIGTDIEYTDSATLGGQFIAKAAGIYSVSFSEQSNANLTVMFVAIRINGSDVAVDNQVYNTVAALNKTASTSWQGYLNVGDIVTAAVNAAAENNGLYSSFTMSKVGKPNVTGVNVTPFVQMPFEKAAVGEITAFAGNVDGNYYLACDGAAINRGTYAQLFAAIGTTYGVGDGSTTFNTPDLRGVFLRGLDAGRGLDTGRVLGSYQADENKTHTHGNAIEANYAAATGSISTPSGLTGRAGSAVTASTNVLTQPSGGVEARPKNVAVNYGIRFKTATDTILTAPETFSTDTAALTYASSAAYTLSTLTNAPVGTFITFTVAAATNAGTQTTTAPTQTTADMNTNGILLTGRAFNATSTAAAPAMMAIQIGKGFKGRQVDGYASASKVTALSLDIVTANTTVEYGTGITYSEKTGILTLDAGTSFSGTSTTRGMGTTLGSAIASGYLVVNASKNPALTGMGIDRVAARAVQSSGQSIPNGGLGIVLTWDATKSYDTHGALNAATGVFTAPISGYYNINVSITLASASFPVLSLLEIFTQKNGSNYSVLSDYNVPASYTSNIGISGSDTIYLSKGDTLSALVYQSAGAARNILTSSSSNHISIAKISGIN